MIADCVLLTHPQFALASTSLKSCCTTELLFYQVFAAEYMRVTAGFDMAICVDTLDTMQALVEALGCLSYETESA